ncbi:hypothetical protein Ciccas_011209 [Cichlidogyrus casuarinus]|uniref:Uncharacterized protein n=1 Tax=Cichlidogyrus casuarinus TaxID=1844966 RepID=A0ABD2PT27_9PLAT
MPVMVGSQPGLERDYSFKAKRQFIAYLLTVLQKEFNKLDNFCKRKPEKVDRIGVYIRKNMVIELRRKNYESENIYISTKFSEFAKMEENQITYHSEYDQLIDPFHEMAINNEPQEEERIKQVLSSETPLTKVQTIDYYYSVCTAL